MGAIPDMISFSLFAIIEQFGEAIYNSMLSKHEYTVALCAHKKLIADLFEEIISLKDATILQLNSHIKLLEQANLIQKEKIDTLQNEIARYKSIIGNNSTNSGVTRRTTMLTGAIRKQDQDESNETTGEIYEYGFPISDDSEEPESNNPVNTYNGRKYGNQGSKGSNRQVGGQFGHEGKTLSRIDVEYIISYCKENGLQVYNITRGVCGKGPPKICYLLGMNPSPFVTKYTIYKDSNGIYDYPKGISKNPVAYDVSVYAYIAYLRFECNLPQLIISGLLRDFTSGIIFPSVGTVNNAISMFADRCKVSFSFLEEEALKENVLHTDATYVFINGNHAYIRNLSSKKFAIYYGMTSKVKAYLKALAFLRNIVVYYVMKL